MVKPKTLGDVGVGLERFRDFAEKVLEFTEKVLEFTFLCSSVSASQGHRGGKHAP